MYEKRRDGYKTKQKKVFFFVWLLVFAVPDCLDFDFVRR